MCAHSLYTSHFGVGEHPPNFTALGKALGGASPAPPAREGRQGAEAAKSVPLSRSKNNFSLGCLAAQQAANLTQFLNSPSLTPIQRVGNEPFGAACSNSDTPVLKDF